MVPIKEYLKKQITVTEYTELIKQIVSLLQKLQGEGMCFELHFDKMQIQNGKLCVQTKAEDAIYELEYVKKFIKDLTFATVFSIQEDCQKVTDFMHALDDKNNLRNLDEILMYLSGTQSQSVSQGSVSRISTPQVQTTQVSSSQGSVSQMNTQPSQQFMQAEDGETGVLDESFWKRLDSAYQEEEPSNGETGVLDPAFWENALKSTPSTRLGNSTNLNRVYGRLIHVKTGQQTIINRDNFWIGKEGVDLQIEKDVISRRHAVIICRENHFFISDNDSTNKTYVDNKEIPPKATVEIFPGTRLKFANIEYEFQL